MTKNFLVGQPEATTFVRPGRNMRFRAAVTDGYCYNVWNHIYAPEVHVHHEGSNGTDHELTSINLAQGGTRRTLLTFPSGFILSYNIAGRYVSLVSERTSEILVFDLRVTSSFVVSKAAVNTRIDSMAYVTAFTDDSWESMGAPRCCAVGDDKGQIAVLDFRGVGPLRCEEVHSDRVNYLQFFSHKGAKEVSDGSGFQSTLLPYNLSLVSASDDGLLAVTDGAEEPRFTLNTGASVSSCRVSLRRRSHKASSLFPCVVYTASPTGVLNVNCVSKHEAVSHQQEVNLLDSGVNLLDSGVDASQFVSYVDQHGKASGLVPPQVEDELVQPVQKRARVDEAEPCGEVHLPFGDAFLNPLVLTSDFSGQGVLSQLIPRNCESANTLEGDSADSQGLRVLHNLTGGHTATLRGGSLVEKSLATCAEDGRVCVWSLA